MWPAVFTSSSSALGGVFHALALWVPEAIPVKGLPLAPVEQKIVYFVSTEQENAFLGRFPLSCRDAIK